MVKCVHFPCAGKETMNYRLASRKGVEPLTYGLGNRCSILLSYRDFRDVNRSSWRHSSALQRFLP